MNLSTAIALTGGLSRTDKMPWYSYNLPTHACVTGHRLRHIRGTVCSRCYAGRGRYGFAKTVAAMDRRLVCVRGPMWARAMICLLNSRESRSRNPEAKYFRWHDSGDLQNVRHLLNIMNICDGTPDIRHWLPTKEYGMVQKALQTRLSQNPRRPNRS